MLKKDKVKKLFQTWDEAWFFNELQLTLENNYGAKCSDIMSYLYSGDYECLGGDILLNKRTLAYATHCYFEAFLECVQWFYDREYHSEVSDCTIKKVLKENNLYDYYNSKWIDEELNANIKDIEILKKLLKIK